MNRRYVLNAGIGLIAVVAVGIVWIANHGADLFSRPQPSADDGRLLAALDEPTWVAALETPLGDVLAELAQRHDVNLRCDEDALKTCGLSARTPVTLHVEDVRLRSALNLLCRRIGYSDATVVVRENEIVLTTREAAEYENPLIGRAYPITPLMFGDGPVDEDSLAGVITSTIQPDSWSDAGGPGVMEVLPGGLAVANSVEVHQQIEQLLNRLEQVSDDDTSTTPIDVGAWPSSRHAAILRSLEQQTTVEFVEAPLADVCDHLANRHGIPIFYDYGVLADYGIGIDAPVCAQLSGIKLKGALNLLLQQLDLDFVVCHDVLMITIPQEVERNSIIRLYPVRDLVGISMPHGADYDSLIELVTSTIAPANWVDVGGEGSIDELAGCLIVSQTRKVHTDIESLLVRLRRRLDPYDTSASEDPISAPVRRIEAALAETTKIEAEDTPLYDIVDDLRKRHEIEIVIDDRALGDMGLDSETPLTDEIVDLTLRQALDRLLWPPDVTFIVRDDVLLITLEGAESQLENRLFDVRHLLDPDFGVAEEESLIDLIMYHESIDSWVDFGGSGEIEGFQGILVVSQGRDVLGNVQALLDGLTQLQNSPDSSAPIAVATALDTGNDAIYSKLESTVDLSFRGVPLDLAVKQLSRDHGLPIWIRREALHDEGVRCDHPVWQTVRNMSLGAALEWILRGPDLACVVRGGSLWITTPYEIWFGLPTRIYPVRDLVCYPNKPPTPPDGPQRRVTLGKSSVRVEYDSLIDAITECIEPDSWADGGGIGFVDWCEDALIISQTPRLHAEVERLLAQIRYHMNSSATRVPPLTLPSPPLSRGAGRGEGTIESAACPAAPVIEQALAASASIQSAGTPLRLLLDQIGQRHNVTVILDTPAYEPIPFPKSFPAAPDADAPIGGRDAPFGGGDDPFGGGGDPFGGGGDPFGGGDDPFGGGDDPFGGGGDPFGDGGDPFAGGDDPFGGGGNPFGDGGDPFAGAADPFGGDEDPFGGGVAAPSDDGEAIPAGVVELTRRGLEFVWRVAWWGLQPWPDGAEAARQWFKLNQERLRFEVAVALKPIHCDISNVPLEEALKQILQPLGLEITIRDEAIWITSPKNEETVLTAEVYDVQDLVQVHRPPQSNDAAQTLSYPDIGFYPNSVQTPGPWNSPRSFGLEYVDPKDLVVELVDPPSWRDEGGPGYATIYNDLLIVRQTRGVHAQIRQFLSFLRREAKQLPSPLDLADEPTQQDIQSLLDYLEQADDPRKLAYILYLIELTAPPAENVVPALMDLLVKLDPLDDAAKHEVLVRVLGSFGRDAEEAVPLLVGQWRALPASHRNPALVFQIGRLGPATVPFLCEVLKAQEEGCTSGACHCLQSIGPEAKEAVDPLLELLNDDEEHNQPMLNALVVIDPDGSLSRQAVARWASDPDQRVRERAAMADEWVRSTFGDPY